MLMNISSCIYTCLQFIKSAYVTRVYGCKLGVSSDWLRATLSSYAHFHTARALAVIDPPEVIDCSTTQFCIEATSP